MIFLSKKLWLWFFVQVCLIIFVMIQYSVIFPQRMLSVSMVSDVMMGAQKMMFNNTLMLSLLLYLTGAEYLRNEFLVRKKGNFIYGIILKNVITAVVFSGLMVLLNFGTAYFLDYSIQINAYSIFFKVATFGLIISLLVDILYIRIGNRLLAILIVAIAHFFLLTSALAIEFYFRLPIMNRIEYWNRPVVSFILVGFGFITLYIIVRKKDYI